MILGTLKPLSMKKLFGKVIFQIWLLLWIILSSVKSYKYTFTDYDTFFGQCLGNVQHKLREKIKIKI